MGNKKIIKYIILFMLVFLITGNISYAAMLPKEIIIETEDIVIDKVRYKDFYLNVSKIIVGDGKAAYCLEIHKEYPAGESFTKNKERQYDISPVMQVGYPNSTSEELGVENDEEAYFATQIALWCYLEGYNANFITGSNTKEVEAIKKIYNESKSRVSKEMNYDINVYYSNEEVQDIVVVSAKEGINNKVLEEIQNYNRK